MGVHTATQLQSFLMDISDIEYTTEAVSYTHLTLPTIYSV